MRDYRGTRRVSAPSVFLAEMQGSETIVVGAESPSSEVVFDPFGDAAARQFDDFSDLVHDVPSRQRTSSRSGEGDGPTFEPDEAQGVPAVTPPPRRFRRSDATIQRASDLAEKMAGGRKRHDYAEGQRVRHAEYGEGVVSRISGTGARAVGTVIFDGDAGRRTFILGHGALEPIDNS